MCRKPLQLRRRHDLTPPTVYSDLLVRSTRMRCVNSDGTLFRMAFMDKTTLGQSAVLGLEYVANISCHEFHQSEDNADRIITSQQPSSTGLERSST